MIKTSKEYEKAKFKVQGCKEKKEFYV